MKKFEDIENQNKTPYLTLKNFLNLLSFLSNICSFILLLNIDLLHKSLKTLLVQFLFNFNFIYLLWLSTKKNFPTTIITLFKLLLSKLQPYVVLVCTIQNFSLVCTYFSHFIQLILRFLVHISSFVYKNAINFFS